MSTVVDRPAPPAIVYVVRVATLTHVLGSVERFKRYEWNGWATQSAAEKFRKRWKEEELARASDEGVVNR